MNIQEVIDQVDIERMYKHLMEIEGIKHTTVDPKKLNETADYIKNELESYGLAVKEHTFSLPGVEHQFRNIEGLLGEGSKPELLITSHYDTVANSPGANDNGSAVVAMLEAARILSKQKITGINIRFISFTLEEEHPANYSAWTKKAQELDLVDENGQYKSYHTQLMVRELFKIFYRSTFRRSFAEASQIAFDTLKEKLNDKETELVQIFVELFADIKEIDGWIGKSAIIGSTIWVEQALKEKKEIIGVLNLETMGYTSEQKGSQNFFSPLLKLLPKYKLNTRKAIGNFIAVAGDKNSRKLAKSFCKQCKSKEIDLPYLNAALPFSYQFIAANVRDLLKSDHAPFLRHGIPAIMITDTAYLRNDYYHTMADTIDKLDFEFMKKVTQATIATSLVYRQKNNNQ